MATFQDNLNIINTAIYGKEMRPAISGALTQSWDAVQIMMDAVDHLNARIDALPDPGGGGGGEIDPDYPDTPDKPIGCYEAGDAILCANGAVTQMISVGDAQSIQIG